MSGPRSTGDRIFWALLAVCAVLALLDFAVHRHAHFAFEAWPGFYGVVGFGAFFLIVLAGKELRKLLRREESFYDR